MSPGGRFGIRDRARAGLLLEMLLLVAVVLLCWALGAHARDAWFSRTSEFGAAGLPRTADVNAWARRANLLFSLGVLMLGGARAFSVSRGRDPIAIPWLVPATALACLLGLVFHHATVELVFRSVDGHRAAVVLAPSALAFAEGFALGAFGAALLLVSPVDPATLATRLRIPIALAMVGTFVALALVGTGPAGSGTRINLGPVQPIELVKLLVVLFLGSYLGARASKLRWHRQRLLGLVWPRPALLVPAVLVLLGIIAGLYVVGDLGPVSILAFVFLGMFYIVTRAGGWAAVSVATVVGLVTLATVRPDLVRVGRVVTRIRMWQEPWWNGIAYGDQLGQGLWAIAAGGPLGRGLAQAHVPLVSAGKTDLVLATLAEQLGARGLVAYLALLATVVLSGFYVASRTRTPERVLIAAGASLLLLAQASIIFAGTFGVLPLTGIVVPFLSFGRSSMVAFLVIVGMIARIAEDGPLRAESAEVTQIQGGARGLAAIACVLLAGALVTCVHTSILNHATISAMAITTQLADGTRASQSNPRLLAIARSLRRGAITDRNGSPLASSSRAPDSGDRSPRRYPLGAAMGTLLGAHPSRVLLPPWALERVFDATLRGYGDRTDGPSGRPWPDLRPFVPLLSLSPGDQARRVRALDADVASRSVRITVDARMQQSAADILARAVRAGSYLAAAAVVIDVDTGEVLARVQVPDLDPNDPTWQESRIRHEPEFTERFTGAYGAWPDKTGVQGFFQSGSVGKIVTALADARSGMRVVGTGCGAREQTSFECTQRDDQGPFFTRPGWARPVHDHFRDATHGRVDLVEAIAVSCNVYFGQLALALGPEPFTSLVNAGVDVGYGRSQPFDPGAPGSRQLASTGFGQGAMVMNVVQAARLVAAVGDGGRYRRCASSMAMTMVMLPSERTAPCPLVTLVDDPRSMAPILAGMRRVMTHGTGRSLDQPEGVRVYGKTGTADVRGFAGEEPFGIARDDSARPHSWFVALAESSTAPECATDARGRIAVAVVVPRGGSGASAAGPIAMQLIDAARTLGLLAPP